MPPLEFIHDRLAVSELVLEPHRVILGVRKKGHTVIAVLLHELHVQVHESTARGGIGEFDRAALFQQAGSVGRHPLRMLGTEPAFGIKRIMFERRCIGARSPVHEIGNTPDFHASSVCRGYGKSIGFDLAVKPAQPFPEFVIPPALGPLTMFVHPRRRFQTTPVDPLHPEPVQQIKARRNGCRRIDRQRLSKPLIIPRADVAMQKRGVSRGNVEGAGQQKGDE